MLTAVKHDGTGSNHQAYPWQYGAPRGSVVLDFRMGRAREGPRLFLDQYEGLLQTDGYAAYEAAASRSFTPRAGAMRDASLPTPSS